MHMHVRVHASMNTPAEDRTCSALSLSAYSPFLWRLAGQWAPRISLSCPVFNKHGVMGYKLSSSCLCARYWFMSSVPSFCLRKMKTRHIGSISPVKVGVKVMEVSIIQEGMPRHVFVCAMLTIRHSVSTWRRTFFSIALCVLSVS